MKIMNYEVFTNNLEDLDLTKKQIINTINPHSYVTAKDDKVFYKALQTSDLLIPDGSGIVIAAKQINKQSIKKIAGADLHKFLLDQMNKKSGKVFYMGAAQKTLDKVEERIKKEYPNITVSSYSPPFKPEFSDVENQEIINRVNEFKPDVLFIGMTAPKQEKWLDVHKDNLNFTTASCIGAVFDFYAGTVERPSDIWVNLHLEWLGRLIKEPKRMWKRNFVSTPLFLIDIFLFKFGFKK
ncbi:MAG: glycosyltransferase [Arcobacter sp.]|mgnify:CR=1 FL=1|nr:glycosyltransferase [Arcobacter sp.]|tara:strand:+ start:9176 stop:9892 length:717 start_codon:yes stop_codon:yes gene_type:complete